MKVFAGREEENQRSVDCCGHGQRAFRSSQGISTTARTPHRIVPPSKNMNNKKTTEKDTEQWEEQRRKRQDMGEVNETLGVKAFHDNRTSWSLSGKPRLTAKHYTCVSLLSSDCAKNVKSHSSTRSRASPDPGGASDVENSTLTGHRRLTM